MELEEIRRLIPFYTANSLSPGEKLEVDAALKGSQALRDELVFWKKARLTARVHAEHLAQGHLSSEQVVDYAERAVSDPKLRSSIEAHLQSCKECREEYEMIRQTMPGPELAAPTILEKARQYITSFKPIYALPVAAALIAGVVLFRSFDSQDNASDTTAMVVLPYRPQMRSESESLPVVAVNPSVMHLQFIVCIPHDSIATTRYTATLTTPEGQKFTQPQALSKIVAPLMDSLKLNLNATLLSSDGSYTLDLAEIPSSLPPGTMPFPPEPYRFMVTHGVRRR